MAQKGADEFMHTFQRKRTNETEPRKSVHRHLRAVKEDDDIDIAHLVSLLSSGDLRDSVFRESLFREEKGNRYGDRPAKIS